MSKIIGLGLKYIKYNRLSNNTKIFTKPIINIIKNKKIVSIVMNDTMTYIINSENKQSESFDIILFSNNTILLEQRHIYENNSFNILQRMYLVDNIGNIKNMYNKNINISELDDNTNLKEIFDTYCLADKNNYEVVHSIKSPENIAHIIGNSVSDTIYRDIIHDDINTLHSPNYY